MTKRVLATSVVAVVLLATGTAGAQSQTPPTPTDSPQWLKDRRYGEGIGIRAGDLELHPGVAGEAGYDSNWFLRTNKTGAAIGNGPPGAPVIPALAFRITPSLSLSTLGSQRREGDLVSAPPSIAFRAGLSATYRAMVGLSSDASQPQNDPSRSNNASGAADARLTILPERPFGGSIYGTFVRTIQPNTASASPDVSFNRDDVGAGADIAIQPGGGTLDWRLGYEFHDTLFESSSGIPYDNVTHQALTSGRWRFRPRTSLVADASLRFNVFTNESQIFQDAALVNSTPVRVRFGLNGLVTERFTLLALAGWGASFLDTSRVSFRQYDSVIGQAELKWFLAASPGVARATEVGLALSSIAVGYTRDFAPSYLSNFYGLDRGYLKFSYFFAGRALATLEGGVGALEYPTLLNPAGDVRHASFTDVRADATFFTEYRFIDSLAINATVKYTQNISDQLIPPIGTNPNTAGSFYAMAYQRFEAYLGLRWFM